MKYNVSKETYLNHIEECLKIDYTEGLQDVCKEAFDKDGKLISDGKQVLSWLSVNKLDIENKIEALRAINGIGFEELEDITPKIIIENTESPEPCEIKGISLNLDLTNKPKSQQSKTDQVKDMVTVFMNQEDFNFETLIEGELVFNGISVTILDFRAATIPSIELVIRDANTEQSEIYNLGITYEESLEIFETEIKDMLFDAFMCFSIC